MNFLQNNTIQKFLRNDATTLILRIILLYLLLILQVLMKIIFFYV